LFSTDDLAAACLAQPEAELTRPFGDDVMVFKIASKMFALVPDNPVPNNTAPNNTAPPSISLKGDPLDNEMLRQRFDAVTGGYHLNKKHWNTIVSNGEVPDQELKNLIEDSYDLVVAGLPKPKRLLLQGQVRAVDSPPN